MRCCAAPRCHSFLAPKLSRPNYPVLPLTLTTIEDLSPLPFHSQAFRGHLHPAARSTQRLNIRPSWPTSPVPLARWPSPSTTKMNNGRLPTSPGTALPHPPGAAVRNPTPTSRLARTQQLNAGCVAPTGQATSFSAPSCACRPYNKPASSP